MAFEHVIQTHEELVALYDGPSGRTQRTAIAYLDEHSLLAQHVSFGKAPRAIIGVEVREAFLHCAKAVTRASLWDAGAPAGRLGLARPAQVWSDHDDLQAPLGERATPLAS
jgi:predicted pyridoxine 5'-phosphate oxidase superfamily flavin-nucleotide-binding protein